MMTLESPRGLFAPSNGWAPQAPEARGDETLRFQSKAAVTRHGVINWEEFEEKFWWVVLHSAWSTKKTRKFRPILRPSFRPEFRPVIKISRRFFRLGNVRRRLHSRVPPFFVCYICSIYIIYIWCHKINCSKFLKYRVSFFMCNRFSLQLPKRTETLS